MKMKLNEMSYVELLELRDEIEKKLAVAERAAKAELLSELQERAKEVGFSLSELMDTKDRNSRPPKYHNPKDRSMTWTGRGRKPNWLVDALKAGHDISEFEV